MAGAVESFMLVESGGSLGRPPLLDLESSEYS